MRECDATVTIIHSFRAGVDFASSSSPGGGRGGGREDLEQQKHETAAFPLVR
jgi:hypothetical protein